MLRRGREKRIGDDSKGLTGRSSGDDVCSLSHSVRTCRSLANPSELSNICPTFIREGTPKGLKTISTGVPSCK
ncbi:hypothetical protein DAI22_06g228000 [Oryza sativa Japonica Group]|nr:hypothetical protein DAI22_06g228000 [Oryza sativa Japonica Group]